YLSGATRIQSSNDQNRHNPNGWVTWLAHRTVFGGTPDCPVRPSTAAIPNGCFGGLPWSGAPDRPVHHRTVSGAPGWIPSNSLALEIWGAPLGESANKKREESPPRVKSHRSGDKKKMKKVVYYETDSSSPSTFGSDASSVTSKRHERKNFELMIKGSKKIIEQGATSTLEVQPVAFKATEEKKE
ncbi:hypothetical protein ACJX0J_012273, partial [Zea mays]